MGGGGGGGGGWRGCQICDVEYLFREKKIDEKQIIYNFFNKEKKSRKKLPHIFCQQKSTFLLNFKEQKYLGLILVGRDFF